jgi:Flp pilus assembly protein TadD
VLRVISAVMVAALAGSCQSRADAALRAGNQAAKAGLLEEARRQFAVAAEARPEDARARALLGNALFALGRPADAAAAWASARERDAAEPAATLGLALLALDAGDAGGCLGQLAALPLSDEVQLTRARALLARGAEGDARAVEQELARIATPQAALLRAGAQLALGRFAEAQAAFSSLQPQAPAAASYGLAQVAAAQGRSSDTLLHLAAARRAAGEDWGGQAVAADPAFEFVRDTDDFRVLTRP